MIRNRSFLPHTFSELSETDAEFDLLAVFNGGVERARVGRIPRLLAKAIGASTTIVTISKGTAKKVRHKHKEITFEDLRELGAVFHEQAAYREGALHLAFVFKSPAPGRGHVKAVIKATRDGSEIFLKTMHGVRGHRLKALLKKTMVIGKS